MINAPQERRTAKTAAGTDPSTRRRPIWRHFWRLRSCGPRRPLPPPRAPAFPPGQPRRARRAGAWLRDPTGAPTAANEEGTQPAHAYRSPAPSRGPTTSLRGVCHAIVRACVFDACLISKLLWQKKTGPSKWPPTLKAADVEKRSSPGGGGMPGLSACVRRLRRAARFPSRLCRYAHCRGSLVNFAHVRAPLVAVVVRMCPADGGGQLHTGAWPVPGRPVCLSCPHLQDGTGPGLRAPWPRSGAGLTTALWQACSRPAHASRA